MHGIIGSTEALLEPGLDLRSVRETAEAIRSCAEHMLALTNNILDGERMEFKRQPHLTSTHFQPVGEVQALLAALRHQAGQKRVTLELKDAGVKHRFRVGDPLRLRQVLFNLVSNAIKFSNEGGRVIVTVTDNSDGGLHLAVQDSGIGIAKGHIDQLFEVPKCALTPQQRQGLTSFHSGLLPGGGCFNPKAMRRIGSGATHQPKALRVHGREHTVHLPRRPRLQVLGRPPSASGSCQQDDGRTTRRGPPVGTLSAVVRGPRYAWEVALLPLRHRLLGGLTFSRLR